MIEVENLTKKFNGATALNGVSFRVNEGEAFAYLGPNGAGKTTTVNILATLFLDEPASGLDPGVARGVLKLILQLKEEGKVVWLPLLQLAA